MNSPFLNFFNSLSNRRKSEPTELDKKITRLRDEHGGINVIDFISQKPPAVQAPMIDSADLIKETNAMAGVSNPALAMLQSNAQAAPSAPALQTFDPTSNDLNAGMLADPEESEEMQNINRAYDEVADKQAFLRNRQRQPFSFFG